LLKNNVNVEIVTPWHINQEGAPLELAKNLMMATSALSPHQNMHFLILFIFIFVVSACQPEANQSWTMNALDSLALWLKTTKNITRNWICLKMRDTSQLLAMAAIC
jgi:hypothetical protein